MKINNVLKIAVLGIASFSVGLLGAVLILSSLPFQFWKNLDASSLIQSTKNLPTKITLPRLYIVQSGSMEPAIKTGSVVVSYPAETYVQGDVITFSPEGNSSKLITHRIVFKLYPDGPNAAPKYITGGDANEDFDTWEIKDEYILGKSILTIPYLGYAANQAKTPYGFILLVIVPATIIIYEELKSLFKEIRKFLKYIFSGLIVKVKKVRTNNNSNIFRPDGSNHQDIPIASMNSFQGDDLQNRKGLPKSVAFIPIFGATLVFTGLASSFFTDIESSIGNLFQASETFGENGNGNGEPDLEDGNPSCQDLGYTYGFKIDVSEMDEQTYTLSDTDGELTGGAPEDSGNSITLSNIEFNDDDPPELILFNWAATLGIDAVVVKGGDNANHYFYDPESSGDTGLHAPINPINNKFHGISHTEFCYDDDI